MKTSILLSLLGVLTGCAFGTSSEIKRAEKMLTKFECNNIETSEIPHTSITSYHERTLAVSREKAESYIESYKAGDILFKIPLDEIVQKQYVIYKASCESLGGVNKDNHHN
ncbi:hypothetical protein [Acinetobacter stercoris]|uniref:Lipoprotein n=1 Tax=Acinetobacter stercoris TaxID=2126983 RepID=A0A2U3N4P7_9GAMM|nr:MULTISPECIES: hypothetical protein [Acinetobacter]SPL72642.1 hypothetical protein KPC_3820 [Acinetobacter stercoris]